MMETLDTLSSPHIVKYHGRSRDLARSSNYLIMEYLQRSTVGSLLHSYKHTSTFLPWPSCYKILVSTAAGMFDMHQAKIAHGDLKWNNVALTDNDQTKLVDFGLSAYVTPAQRTYLLAISNFNDDIRSFGYMIDEIVEHTNQDAKYNKSSQELLGLATECKTAAQTINAEKLCKQLHQFSETYSASANSNAFFSVEIPMDNEPNNNGNMSDHHIELGLFSNESPDPKTNEVIAVNSSLNPFAFGAKLLGAITSSVFRR
jgi:serine/threonine protein kinase